MGYVCLSVFKKKDLTFILYVYIKGEQLIFVVRLEKNKTDQTAAPIWTKTLKL